ncbi:MAG: hypothetical protein KF773_14815 [Deltaproteobacteria bacterium]|nr:hypothetical protein [Deltaproteobacteria bacterium]
MRISVIAAAALIACAPAVDGPAERQRARDVEDGARLRAQVAALPGVDRVEVILARPARDPLAPPHLAAPRHVVSVVAIVDDRADRDAVASSTAKLARSLAPAAEPTIVVEVGAIRPELARVGPFEVAASSRRALQGTLVALLALVVGAAGLVVFRRRQRRGNRAQ